jgi:alanine dehydrogenase
MALANKGIAALDDDEHLARGLNVNKGELVHPAVKEALSSLSAA